MQIPTSTSSPKPKEFDSIESTIEAFRRGEFIVVLDDQNRENEGDLIIAAEDLTTEKMAFMVRYTSGLICAPLTSAIATELQLPQMVVDNADPNRTAYTVSIDADDESVSTGISAHDRALTCRTLASKKATAASFRRPGHVFPYALAMAVSSSGPATPRPPWSFVVWRARPPSASSVK